MKAWLNWLFWFFFIGWRASLFRSIFMWLVSHIVLFLPWLSPGIVRLLSLLAVFTFFILILYGAVVGIQWLSYFHFLRLNIAILILAFHHHVVVFRRIVRMWLYYVKLVGREFRMYKLVFEVLVALVWDKWSLGP